MSRKFICWLTIFFFVIFDFSCVIHTTRKMPLSSVKGEPDVQILGVVKTSGEYIMFPEDSPGRVTQDGIEGPLELSKKLEIDRSEIQSMKRSKEGVIYELTTKDGRTYQIYTSKEVGNKVIFEVKYLERTLIPLSEIEMVQVRKVDQAASFLATIGGIAGTLLLAVGIIALVKESCPFIYSYDGARYHFDAEPYGGATCRGLKRKEWCRLEYLKEVRGQYRILIKNEVDETQHTDEVKLVVVDHPAGTMMVPEETGQLHTVAQPFAPARAYDGKGKDILPLVLKNDWLFWQTKSLEKNPEKTADLRDDLTFEFLKPEGARRAKLIFNGCNTLWGSQMLKRMLELYGDKVGDWYTEVNNHGPAYNRMNLWNLREELYRLQIRVETREGWRSMGTLVGGGPFASEDKAYILDLAGVPLKTLRIKLTPPATFWMINSIAVDYTEDLPFRASEISPLEALDRSGKDVRELLVATDDDDLTMPNIGDTAELTFLAPPAPARGYQRSIFVKASGYYDIHLQATGEPRWDILNRFGSEPGFTIQYALKEYLKWRQESPHPAQSQ